MIILLDIDGVMVPASSWKSPELLNDGFPNFSTKAVDSLNKILSTTEASILLITSHKSNYSVASWRRIFAKRGIIAKISKLRNNNRLRTRKDEVLKWIQTHQSNNNFIIIDDDKSLNDLPVEFKRKLILTSPLIGLNESLADQAINALRQSEFVPA
jgi:HAD domain in Swiss Army Knife RNA repair proteins